MNRNDRRKERGRDKSLQKGDKSKYGEQKENLEGLKYVLKKSYTENHIKDLSIRK